MKEYTTVPFVKIFGTSLTPVCKEALQCHSSVTDTVSEFVNILWDNFVQIAELVVNATG